MAKITDNQNDEQRRFITTTDLSYKALLDDGGLYDALGIEELQSLATTILQNWSRVLDAILKNLDRVTHWQYGSGQHNCARKTIFGSIVLPILSDAGTLILIRHAVLEGSSQ